MIVADTGAVLALIDADDRHHEAMLSLYERDPAAWVLPAAILPEVDHLLLHHMGRMAELTFLRDLAEGSWSVEWGSDEDLARARELCERYREVGLGLVDALVIVTAERLRATAIATLDVKHFGPIRIHGAPRLVPQAEVGGRP